MDSLANYSLTGRAGHPTSVVARNSRIASLQRLSGKRWRILKRCFPRAVSFLARFQSIRCWLLWRNHMAEHWVAGGVASDHLCCILLRRPGYPRVSKTLQLPFNCKGTSSVRLGRLSCPSGEVGHSTWDLRGHSPNMRPMTPQRSQTTRTVKLETTANVFALSSP